MLRPLCADDFEALHGIVSQYEVTRQLGSWPWPPDPEVTRARCVPFAGHGDIWAITYDDKFLGTLGVNIGSDGKPGIGYQLDPAYHRRGFMFEAAHAAIEYAFRNYGWRELHAGTWFNNQESGSLLLKLGFERTENSVAKSHARGGEEVVVHNYHLCRENFR